MIERVDFMKEKYQRSVKDKQNKLRARSTVNKTEPSVSSQRGNGRNGFLNKMFGKIKNPTVENDQQIYDSKDEDEFKFAFFDQFCYEPVNITGDDQPMQRFQFLIDEHKTHQIQQIRLISIPKSGEKISLRFKQKIQIVLTHFFPYEVVFSDKEYQITLSNKIQRHSTKYNSFVNLSNARTFLEDKNKKPSYVLLVPNVFQDLNEIKREFDQLVVGLVDGVFNNQTVTAQKTKCITYSDQRIGVSSIHNWRDSKSFVNTMSTCIHQILHVLQFEHCFRKKCLMNLKPNDAGLSMCSECLEKFCVIFKVDLRKWFGQLSEVLRIIEETEESNKLREIYEALQDTNVQ